MPDDRAVGELIPGLVFAENGGRAGEEDGLKRGAGVKGDLRGAAMEFACGGIGGGAGSFRENDDVHAVREEAGGILAETGGIVVDEKDAAHDPGIEEIARRGRFGQGGGVRQKGHEDDDVDQGDVVGHDNATAQVREAVTVLGREADIKQTRETGGRDEEAVGGLNHASTGPRARHEEKGQQEAADQESAQTVGKEEKRAQKAARQPDGTVGSRGGRVVT